MTVITATVDVLAVDTKGRLKMVLTNHIGKWTLVGGHVEPGDSWASAAINELEEEAGIIANKADLELFATISGGGRIYHYQDGDTRPFTVIYLIKKWSEERMPGDDEEVAKTKWASLEEAKKMDINDHTQNIIEAYERYLDTGKLQEIEEGVIEANAPFLQK